MCHMTYLCFFLLGLLPAHTAAALPYAPVGVVHIRAMEPQPAQGRDRESAESISCRRFVGEFYSWYVSQSKNGDPLRTALRQKRANFSSELVRRLNEDRAAAAKNPNEVVGLDFDPVINSQDTPEKYVPGKVTPRNGRYLVDVYSIYGGKKGQAAAVIPELRHERGRWVFTNFLYKTDGKTDDLLSLLVKLKADRMKGK